MLLKLKNAGIQMELCIPDRELGYYRGTRFDWSGIFHSIQADGANYVEEWFDDYDPLRHDCVCGPVDEFAQTGFEEAGIGDTFLKIGVGLLRKPDSEDYDRFRLYEIADHGTRTVENSKNSARFRHFLLGDRYGYDYVKEISIDGRERTVSISCRLLNLGPESIETSVYNHNFWTLGQKHIGPDTLIDFPFRPAGKWRAPYDCVRLTESGIRFSRILENGETVAMDCLQSKSKYTDGYGFTLANAKNGSAVEAVCNRPMEYMKIWANHRIACPEPYIHLRLFPGEAANWNIDYRLR